MYSILREKYICRAIIHRMTPVWKPVSQPAHYPPAAEVMIGPSTSSLHQLSSTSHKCLFLCYFSLDFRTHITFDVDESELSTPSGALGADSVMCAAICKPIVWHCTVSWSCRLSQWNCQVMNQFHTDCSSLSSHLFCSYLSGKKIHSSHSSTHAPAFSRRFCT